jgi:hypothetical protein
MRAIGPSLAVLAILIAGVGLAPFCAGTLAAERTTPPDSEKHQPSEALRKLLDAGDVVQIKTVDGETGGVLDAATSLPGQSNRKGKDLAFVVPAGYVRFRISGSTQHNSGDSASFDWANGDPHDGTVHLEVHASGIDGYAHAQVDSAYAIKPGALVRMHEEAVKHKASQGKDSARK